MVGQTIIYVTLPSHLESNYVISKPADSLYSISVAYICYQNNEPCQFDDLMNFPQAQPKSQNVQIFYS